MATQGRSEVLTPTLIPTPEIDLDTFGAEYGEVALVLRQCTALKKIENDDQYRAVGQAVLDAAANMNSLKALLEPMRKTRYDALQRVYDVIKQKCEPFEQVKRDGSALLATYQAECNRLAEIAEEAERKRQFEEAEVQKAQQAEQLAKEGRVEEGIAVLDSTPILPPVVGVRSAPKMQGISNNKEVWTAEVTDIKALLQGVLDGKVPAMAVVADQKFLDKQADLLKNTMVYPGVKVNRGFKLASVRARK